MKTYEDYYDSYLDKKFKLLSLSDSDLNAEDLNSKYRDDIYKAVLESLREMAKSKYIKVPCFLTPSSVFEIRIETYEEHYKSCLKYFTLIEEYETCSELVNINKNIKDG